MAVRSSAPTMVNTEWKILIIDDDEDDFLIARDMLKEAKGRKFNVHWASTYAEGREELKSDHYNAVLVDYDLGMHSGVELIREANQRGYPCPLILFTGRGSYEVDVEAMEAGATMYLTKGEVSPLLLERAVRYAIEIKQKENELRQARETAERELAERKRAEEALRRIDARWNAAIESFNVGVIIATEDEQVIYWNPAAQQMHGFTRPDEGIEPLEKTPVTFQLWTPDGSHLLALDEWPMRRIKRGETVRDMELRIRRPDQGWEKVFSYSGVMVDTASGESLIFLTCYDLTEKRRSEDALRESEERLRMALDAAQMVVWDYDPATLKVALSENAEEVLELPQRHENSDQGYGLIHPDDVENHRALVTQAIATGGSYVSVYRHPHTEKVIWLEEHGRAMVDQAGKTVRLMGVVQNITGRKQAEDALRESEATLRESEEHFRRLADAMPQLVWTARADGKVDYYNQRYKEYDGFAPAEGDMWDWGPVLHLDDLQPTLDAWNQAVETGEVYQIEHRVRMSDGSYCWHLSRAIPIKDEGGSVIRWYGTATNIHVQKESQERLQRSNQELEQFAFVASHDLQEPLRKISQFGNRLRDQLRDTPDTTADDYLTRMQSAAERMHVMIQGLLELSRINSRGGNFQPTDLNRAAGDALSDLEGRIQQARGRVQIHELPSVEADELQMRQLFQNLIANAIKFQKPDVPPLVEVSGNIDPSHKPPVVEIRVADNGIGFEQEYAEQIFQPFQRLHNRSAYEGTGLGLAICKKIVERHQGTIEAHSTLGEGTTFIVRLPAKPTS